MHLRKSNCLEKLTFYHWQIIQELLSCNFTLKSFLPIMHNKHIYSWFTSCITHCSSVKTLGNAMMWQGKTDAFKHTMPARPPGWCYHWFNLPVGISYSVQSQLCWQALVQVQLMLSIAGGPAWWDKLAPSLPAPWSLLPTPFSRQQGGLRL